MLYLIPSVKVLFETGGFLKKTAIYYNSKTLDKRLTKALSHLHFDENGTPLSVSLNGNEGEGYSVI